MRYDTRASLRTVVAVVSIALLSFLAWAIPQSAVATSTNGQSIVASESSISQAGSGGSQGVNATTGSSTNSTHTVSSLLPPAEAAAAVESFYNSGGPSGTSNTLNASAATISAAATAIDSAFQTVSQYPGFLALYNQFGPPGFDFEIGSTIGGGAGSANLGFHYVFGGLSITTSWSTNLSTGLTSGPTNVSGIAASAFDSPNWGGSEAYVGLSLAGAPELDVADSDEAYPAAATYPSTPANVPGGTNVYQVVAVWAGLDDAQDGTGNLAQDGYTTNASACLRVCNTGQPFYEFYCPNIVGNCMPTLATYSTFPTVNTNDVVTNLVRWANYPGLWEFQTKDYSKSTGNVGTAFEDVINNSWLSGGFHPHWADYINEAYGIHGLTQQISDFSQTNFYDVTICKSSGGCVYTNSASYVYYRLDQQCGAWLYGIYNFICISPNLNTNQGYTNSNGGYWGEFGYPYVTWQNSDYDWNCVTGRVPCD
jgi:hypothetical protein